MAFSNELKVGIIDLTLKSVTLESISFDSKEFSKYLGGDGFVAEYLLKNMPTGVDPLSPENYLCFITGILSATKVPFSGRYTVVAKSPLTNTWGEANSGGRFGPELRKTGFDILIIGGKADQLSTIIVTDYQIEINFDDSLISDAATRDEIGNTATMTCIFNVIYHLGLTGNFLRNKKWKQTQVFVDKKRFYEELDLGFNDLIWLIIRSGIKSKYELLNLYCKKFQVNQFRQRSKY